MSSAESPSLPPTEQVAVVATDERRFEASKQAGGALGLLLVLPMLLLKVVGGIYPEWAMKMIGFVLPLGLLLGVIGFFMANLRAKGLLEIGLDGICIHTKSKSFFSWNEITDANITTWQYPLGIYDREVLTLKLESDEVTRLEVEGDLTTTLDTIKSRKQEWQQWQDVEPSFKEQGEYRLAASRGEGIHVRVCLDPAQEHTTKEDAFSRLDSETQEELLASLVEPDALKRKSS